MPLMPTPELAACGWVALILGLGASNVGLNRPQDPATWHQNGFVQLGPVTGGTPDAYTPARNTVISTHVWAITGKQNTSTGKWNWSEKPPWNQAAEICEQIRAASLPAQYSGSARQVAMLVAGYAHATVSGTRMLTEPRRILSEPDGSAHMQFDLQLIWIPQGS